MLYRKYYPKAGFVGLPSHYTVDVMPEVGNIVTPDPKYLPQQIATYPTNLNQSIRRETYVTGTNNPTYPGNDSSTSLFKGLNERIAKAPQPVEHFIQRANSKSVIKDYSPNKDGGVLNK